MLFLLQQPDAAPLFLPAVRQRPEGVAKTLAVLRTQKALRQMP